MPRIEESALQYLAFYDHALHGTLTSSQRQTDMLMSQDLAESDCNVAKENLLLSYPLSLPGPAPF